jgi:hypothetical protein
MEFQSSQFEQQERSKSQLVHQLFTELQRKRLLGPELETMEFLNSQFDLQER